MHKSVPLGDHGLKSDALNFEPNIYAFAIFLRE